MDRDTYSKVYGVIFFLHKFMRQDIRCQSCNLVVPSSSLSTRHKKLLLCQIWINLLISCLMNLVQKENNPVHLGLGVSIH